MLKWTLESQLRWKRGNSDNISNCTSALHARLLDQATSEIAREESRRTASAEEVKHGILVDLEHEH